MPIRKITLRIEPVKGKWIVSARMPGLLSHRSFIGTDGTLTSTRKEVREYETAASAYCALEKLAQSLEAYYPGTPQEWEVSCCASQVLSARATDDTIIDP